MWQHGLLRYFTNFTNWGQLLRNGFLLGADYCLHHGLTPQGRSYTALGVILAGALSMRYFRNLHNEIGHTLDMLRQAFVHLQVLMKVATVFFCNIVYIISFTVAVGLWFSSNSENSKSQIGTALRNQTNSIGGRDLPDLQYNDTSGVFPFQEIIMMMTGSIDTEKVNDALPFVGQVGFLNFLIFIILMVVLIFAIYNQLTGVAIAKVSEMTEKAEVHRVMSKIEYIFLVETLTFIMYQFLCIIFRCANSKTRLARYFRRLDIASSDKGEYSECIEIRSKLNPVNHSMKDSMKVFLAYREFSRCRYNFGK
ncbi:Transient receptor potential cation channel protein painless [Folsomia candida]|uniref:Transient receptor potential cation channel protein painless n=1 Tax=Folsomia candida TaxID=158441 RepID=A0A226D8L2_FOLCA|nr:Transient receptor potential cation channel protein painless [Folsomia candida]